MKLNKTLVCLLVIFVSIGVADASTSVTVTANPLWTDTGLAITNGQMVSITATGSWTTGIGGSVGPDGDGSPCCNWDLFLMNPPAAHGELIAFVGPDPYQGHWGDGSFFPQPIGAGYWAIGSSASFTSDRNGELWLGINDDAVSKATGDNGGMQATIITSRNIPEFPTVAVPVVSVIGLLFIFGRRKK